MNFNFILFIVKPQMKSRYNEKMLIIYTKNFW